MGAKAVRKGGTKEGVRPRPPLPMGVGPPILEQQFSGGPRRSWRRLAWLGLACTWHPPPPPILSHCEIKSFLCHEGHTQFVRWGMQSHSTTIDEAGKDVEGGQR